MSKETVERNLIFRDISVEKSKELNIRARDIIVKALMESRDYFCYIDSIGQNVQIRVKQ